MNLNDVKMKALGDLGYEGSINEREYQFWKEGGGGAGPEFQAGDGIVIDNSDPENPVIAVDQTEVAPLVDGKLPAENQGNTFLGDFGTSLSVRVETVDIELDGPVTSVVNFLPNGSLILGVMAVVLEEVTGSEGVHLHVGNVGVWGNSYTGNQPLEPGVGEERRFCAPFSPQFVQYGDQSLSACVVDENVDSFTGGKIKVAVYYFSTTPISL